MPRPARTSKRSRARGVELVGPDEGETAEGEWGVGRMAEPGEIAARIEQLLAPGSLAGKRVLVTAGGTREPLDAVRFVGNRSSGRMGVALAEEARRRGADVVLLAANLAVPAPRGVETIPTPTAEAMLDAALALEDIGHRASGRGGRRLPAGRGAALESAPRAASRGRSSSSRRPTSPGCSASASGPDSCSWRSAPTSARPASSGSARCSKTKNADLVVFNDVSRSDIAFDAAENEVVLVSRDGDRPVAKASKRRDRAAILDEIERLLG